jgi:SAM-dependent methyltransferase
MSEREHPVLRREHEWEQVAGEVLGGGAELLAVSRWVPDSRAYAAGDRVAVIRLVGADGGAKGSFAASAKALSALDRPFEQRVEPTWEALVVPRAEGSPLEFLLPQMPLGERVRVLRRVAAELSRLHHEGVAHRDLRPDNVIVRPDGTVDLVDFDRAVVGGRRSAAAADWLGASDHGLTENAFWSLALFTLAPRSRSLGRRLRGIVRRPRSYVHEWADGDAEVPDDVRLLARAWASAQFAGANAPGQGLAYYAFTYRGYHLPGERPWNLRWEAIRQSVGFEGKALLELGCNLGLLSSFALLHGARSAVGIDRNEQIVGAARLVAEALEVSPEFRRLDLTSSDWEAGLPPADVVAALSVVHWLPDPDRVLRFLGRHAELIYEGHDSLEQETERLRSVGFAKVEVVLESERGRYVLHGRK